MPGLSRDSGPYNWEYEIEVPAQLLPTVLEEVKAWVLTNQPEALCAVEVISGKEELADIGWYSRFGHMLFCNFFNVRGFFLLEFQCFIVGRIRGIIYGGSSKNR